MPIPIVSGRRCRLGAAAVIFLLCAAAPAQEPSFFARRDYPDINPFAALVGDFNGDQIPDVVVDTGASIGVCTYFGKGDGSFLPGPCSSSLYNDYLLHTLTVDVNGDGKLDLAYMTSNKGNVQVALGNGDGTFADALVAPGIQDGNGLVLADMNGDGKLDVVVTTHHDAVMVAFGHGDGTFDPPVVTTLAGALGLAAVDLNGDGKLDLLVTTQSSTVALLGRGDGTFTQSQSLPGNCLVLAASRSGDLNGDGRADVVMGCYESSSQIAYVATFLNQGDGTVRAGSVSQVSGVVKDIAIGDVNGDGRLDVVAVGGVGTAFVLLGKGNGKLAAPYSFQLSGDPGWVGLADLRRSGTLDMVVTAVAANTWSVLLNNGRGRFRDGVPVSLVNSADWGVSADLNRDGHPDLVVTTASGIQVLYGTGRAAVPFVSGAQLSLPLPVRYVAAGDFNNDGEMDVVAAMVRSQDYTWSVEVFLGQGSGQFSDAGTYQAGPAGRFLGPLLVSDLNHDHNPDLISTSGVMLGNGDGTFQPFSAFSTTSLDLTPGFNFHPALKDFNGDGNLDVATFTFFSGHQDGKLVILLGKGDGTFQAPLVTTFQGNFAYAGDFNRDGISDLMVGTAGNGGFNLFLGNGDGTFRQGPFVNLLNLSLRTIYAGAIGDFNGDGDLDVAVTSQNGFLAIVVLGNGDGTFWNADNPLVYGTGPYPTCILARRFYRGGPRGLDDLLTVNGTLTLLPNITQ